MNIVSKFVIGSDKGIDEYFDVKKKSISNTYREDLPAAITEDYIANHFDHRKMITILNDFSNQLIMVYADDQPAGYCLFQSGLSYGEAVQGDQKMTAITEFNILPAYDVPEVRISLWNKVKSAIQFTDSIWINMTEKDVLLQFFKDRDFVFIHRSTLPPFDLPSAIYELRIS